MNVWETEFIISSGTDEVRAKREPSLCNESVKRHVWFFSDTAATQKTRFASLLGTQSRPLAGLLSLFFDTGATQKTRFASTRNPI